MKLTVTKSKNSASFYVQKSIRKKTGGTTSITSFSRNFPTKRVH